MLYPSIAIRKIFAACHGKSKENLRTLRSQFSKLYPQQEKSKAPAQLCFDPRQGLHDSHPHGRFKAIVLVNDGNATFGKCITCQSRLLIVGFEDSRCTGTPADSLMIGTAWKSSMRSASSRTNHLKKTSGEDNLRLATNSRAEMPWTSGRERDKIHCQSAKARSLLGRDFPRDNLQSKLERQHTRALR